MKRKTWETREKTNNMIIRVEVDITSIPSKERLQGRLKNRSCVFEDRRFKRPKYKKNYMED